MQQALDFLRSLLKTQPEERLNVREIMNHPFLKIDVHPFKVSKESDFVSDVIKTDGTRGDIGHDDIAVKPN